METSNLQMNPADSPAATVSVNIFNYDDFRIYLKDFYAAQKKRYPMFSFRTFAARAGYRSSGILKVVMEGKRNLSSKAIAQFIKALRLKSHEGEFFRNLVMFNQSATVEERQKFARLMLLSKVYCRLRPVTAAKFQYWSEWHNVAIREMVVLEDFREDPEWIAAQLRPAVTPEQAATSIAQLLELGLLKRDEKGFLMQAENEITTGDSLISAVIADFHRQMLLKAREALDRFQKAERQFSALTLALSAEGEDRVRQMIHNFRKELLAVAEEDARCSRVVQINFQLFPLAGRAQS